MYKVIAFCGLAQSGKTTNKDAIQEILKAKYPKLIFQHISFAAKLKEIAFDLFEWDGDKELYYPMQGDDLGSPMADKGRQLLINIGQFMRQIRSTVWADYVSRKLEEEIATGEALNKIYVVDDLRFPNEIEGLKEAAPEHLILIKIKRKSELKLDDISETALNNFDDYNYTIENNGTKKDLSKKLEIILSEILKVK